MEINQIFKIIEERDTGGKLFVVSAPSGTGKTTLCHMVVRELDRVIYSISTTSRAPRQGEVDGRDYFFVSKEEFENRIRKNELLEWAKVHGHYYGTSRKFIEENLKQGKYIILDIDVQGGIQIKKKFPKVVLIFMMPPSMDELEKRLKSRKLDSENEIRKRLENSYEEISYVSKYDFLVVNNKLDEALSKLKCIIDAKMCEL